MHDNESTRRRTLANALTDVVERLKPIFRVTDIRNSLLER